MSQTTTASRPAQNARWTRESIIAALRDFRARTGKIPTSIDACAANRLPAPPEVCRVVGAWLTALELAFPDDDVRGQRQRGQRLTREQAIAAVRAYDALHGFTGHGPTFDAWAEQDRATRPNARALSWRFGSLRQAWQAAGLAVPPEPLTSPEEILDAIRRWVARYGRAPRRRDWDVAAARRAGDSEALERLAENGPWPSYRAVRRAFGDMPTALAAAELPDEIPTGRWTREELIAAIQRWTAQHDGPPRQADWDLSRARRRHPDQGAYEAATAAYRSGRWPHRDTVVTEFGSWAAAIRAAGLEPRTGVRPPRWNQRKCVTALAAFIAEHGRVPRGDEYGPKGPGGRLPVQATVAHHCGSLTAALDAARQQLAAADVENADAELAALVTAMDAAAPLAA